MFRLLNFYLNVCKSLEAPRKRWVNDELRMDISCTDRPAKLSTELLLNELNIKSLEPNCSSPKLHTLITSGNAHFGRAEWVRKCVAKLRTLWCKRTVRFFKLYKMHTSLEHIGQTSWDIRTHFVLANWNWLGKIRSIILLNNFGTNWNELGTTYVARTN